MRLGRAERILTVSTESITEPLLDGEYDIDAVQDAVREIEVTATSER